MGSIRLILESLDLNREEYDQQLHPLPFRAQGAAQPKTLVKRRRSTAESIKKFFRGSEFVRHLIPDNIKEVEFIYRVNFDAGTDKIDVYLQPLSMNHLWCIAYI